MALINCPECNKEISDKVKACPYCGYPLIDNDETQKVEVTSVKLQINKDKPKKIVATIVGILFVVGIVFVFYLSSKQEQYSKDFNIVIEEMLACGSDAEDLINLTSNVWYNTIYEEEDYKTDKYTRTSYGYFVSDFNTSLQNLYTDKDTIVIIANIKLSQEKVSALMKQLNSPPSKYKVSYETLLEMYNAYQGVTDLAINPKGSLQSFRSSSNEKIEQLVGLYKKIQTQLPD
jgi:uncharacterized membrane protein YvbJ